MNNHNAPAIDSRYVTLQGVPFLVIGRGTGGVIVQYEDGRVELLSKDRWNTLQAIPASAQTH